MTDHQKGDALDLIRTDLQLFLRQYKRRVQTEAEAIYARKSLEASRSDAPFDHLSAAREALEEAKGEWLGVSSSPQKAIEGEVVER
jgi:hypothetical protein